MAYKKLKTLFYTDDSEDENIYDYTNENDDYDDDDNDNNNEVECIKVKKRQIKKTFSRQKKAREVQKETIDYINN